MIQRNVQELNSFIRIDKLSDLTNKNFNLEVGNDIFVMENLTFYKIKAVGTEPVGEGEIALNSELKIKKIITVGDSSDLKTKLDALSSEIETKLSRKENVIDKKSGFNLEKTNDFLNDESKILTSKAGSILKTRIDDVNDRLNSINLTWDRIQNKPLITSINSENNNNNIPSEGAIIRYVNGRIDSVNTTINSKIGEVNTKITALEGRPFTYDALLNKPVISDAINSNLSNQIASSKAILDASNAIKEHIAGNFISNKITDTSITTENKIQFYNSHYIYRDPYNKSLIEIKQDSEFARSKSNYFSFGGTMLFPESFDIIKSVGLKINSFNLNGIQVDNTLLFNNGEIFYKSSPVLPKWTKIAMEDTYPEFKGIYINKTNGVYDFEVHYTGIKANKDFHATKILTGNPSSVLIEVNQNASFVSNEAVIGSLITTGGAEVRGGLYSSNLTVGNKLIAGEIECRGNVKAYYASDIRLKSNIKKIDGALDKIDKISGYTFDMDGKREAGIIAQEIKEVLPEVVGEFEKDGEMYLNVDYPKIIALLVEAIKELKNGR